MRVGVDASVVEEELKALSAIGPEGVFDVEGEGGFFSWIYTIHFTGPLSATNLGPLRGLIEAETISSPSSNFAETLIQGGNNAPVLVEAHLTGLTPGATYHYKLVAANSLGTVSTDDQVFVPPLAANESACPNEQERTENNSTRLPECRAYELVTNRPKGGFSASLAAFSNSESGRLIDRMQAISKNPGRGDLWRHYLRCETNRSRLGNGGTSQRPEGHALLPARQASNDQGFGPVQPGPRALDLVPASRRENVEPRTYAKRMENSFRSANRRTVRFRGGRDA